MQTHHALPSPTSKKEAREIFSCLEDAHDALVRARKVAALSSHKSYKKIGHCLDCLEEIFESLCPLPPKKKKP